MLLQVQSSSTVIAVPADTPETLLGVVVRVYFESRELCDEFKPAA
jgi:hypothetical protein